MLNRSLAGGISEALMDYLSGHKHPHEIAFPGEDYGQQMQHPEFIKQMINMNAPIGEIGPLIKEMQAGLGHLMNPEYLNATKPIEHELEIANVRQRSPVNEPSPQMEDPYLNKFKSAMDKYKETVHGKQNEQAWKTGKIYSSMFDRHLNERSLNRLLDSYENSLKEELMNYRLKEKTPINTAVHNRIMSDRKERIAHLKWLLNSLSKGE
jgi:hypothetical protein